MLELRRLIRSTSLALMLGVLAVAPNALAQQAQPGPTAPQLAFSHEIVVRDGERMAAAMTVLGASDAGRQAQGELLGAHKVKGLEALAAGSDPRAAVRHLSLAVARNNSDGEAWRALAQALLAVVPSPNSGNERYKLPADASGAAWQAYGLAVSAQDKASALAILAEAMQRRSMWRPAIAALKIAMALDPRPEVAKSLAKLRAERGFRVVDYKIDADAAAPRLCINFSEPVGVDGGGAAKFVTLDGREPESLTSEGRQICIDGLKHGARYSAQIRAGLNAASDETLAKAAEIAVYVRDRKPAVRLTGRAYVLPSRGQQGIPVVSVNAASLDIEILRIGDRGLGLAANQGNFLKTIESWDIEQVREHSGRKVWSGRLDVASRLNEDVTTAIPVSEALGKLEPGVYIVAASVTDARGDTERAKAAQWFVVSDLGLTAFTGNDGLHTFVRSLATTERLGGVTVRLLARNNEVLGESRTDARGYARFDVGLTRGEGGLSPRMIVAQGQGDYGLLDLGTAAFDLSDRGVKGRPTPGPLDGYLFAERGVYRPGEKVHLTGLVRTAKGLASDVPVTLIVARPDGVEHRRQVLADAGLGGRTLTLELGRQSMTGTWRARLHGDPKAAAIAEAAFLVEDFVPERLSLTLSPKTETIARGGPASIAVTGRYLYGPPAAGLDLEGEIVVRAAKDGLKAFPGYQFGVAGERFTGVREGLAKLGQTDAGGAATVSAALPNFAATSQPLEASVLLRLRESGGRAIERRVTLPVAATSARVGIKPRFDGGQVGEGEEARFDVILLGADGKPVEGKALNWEIVALDRRWQWYSHEGQWRFEPVTTTRRMARGTVQTRDANGRAEIAFQPSWGRYRIEVSTGGRGGPRSSVIFNAGWQAGDAVDSPEVLDIALDKGSYKAGEAARLRINTREAGRALVAVVSGGVLATHEIAVPAGGTEMQLTVDKDWLPGAYVTATLYRALDETSRRMPGRAVGVTWLGLDTKPQTLDVALELPEKVLPGRTLKVPVRVGGLQPGEDARITVAAVDVGILNLTRYQAPAPQGWFYAQRQLGLEMRDLYGRLIDGMRAERGRLRSGGDGSGGMSAAGSPPVEAPLSLYSGIVKVGADGAAEVAFELPEFNGQVRVMAVAWSAGKVGSSAKDVIVRDKLALTVSAPRFLLLGDEARLAVEVHNIEGPDAAYDIAVTRETADGLRKSLARPAVTLTSGARHSAGIAMKPEALGRTVYDVRVTGPDGIDVRRRVALEVQAPAVGIRRRTVSKIAADGGKLVVSQDLFHDLIATSARLSLTVGPTAAFDVAGLLGQLDRYPYGCAEQTTSRALPLLYVNDMAKRLGIAEEAEIKTRIGKAIAHLMEMQDATGAFGIWGPADGDIWLTAYVTDFLTRAKEAGHAVKAVAFNQALDRLANALAYAQDFEKGGEARAYALYVLARNGRAPVGDLRYYVDARLERFATPLAKAQLGAALALIGDNARAGKAFDSAMAGLAVKADDASRLNGARADYGSLVRDGAGVLTLAAETRMLPARHVGLAEVLAAAFQARQHTSTQEQAWLLLAARAVAEEAKATRLMVAGRAHEGELTMAMTPADLAKAAVEIANTGSKAVHAVISVEGASLTPEPPIAQGLTIERAYYTLDGNKVDLASGDGRGGQSRLAQNQRLVAVVSITGRDAGGRVLVVDRLPAGLEVENPRLVDSGDVATLGWLKGGRRPEHTEFRDDRVIAAFSFFDGRRRNGGTASSQVRATVAYIVRAVTPGRYAHPAATVEDMYRAEMFARTAAGQLVVEATK